MKPITYRLIPLFLVSLTALTGIKSAMGQSDTSRVLSRIAFGSCANQNNDCPIWGTIDRFDPDLLLLLGDNIYADLVDGRLKPSTPTRIKSAYDALAALPEFAKLRSGTPMMATWDDHDYGNNDAGREWEHKTAAAQIFHDFFETPADSPRRNREGVYHSAVFGPEGKRTQIILLDTRSFRSELRKADEPLPGMRARPYIATDGDNATLLGEQQWKWLKQQLLVPAEVRIIGSSIQLLSNDHPYEKWGNFPLERERFYKLVRECGSSGVIVLSGDRHLGEISMDAKGLSYPLYDITASGLNQANRSWRETEKNAFRLAALQYGNHFGSIEIDWNAEDPLIKMQLRHEDGEIAVQARIPLSKLQSAPAMPELPSGIVGPMAARDLAEGAEVKLQMRVVSGRELGNRSRILLNSEENYRSSRNFTVVVNGAALKGKLANAGLESFKGKQILVTGKISIYRNTKQLAVDSPEQIEFVE